MDESGSLKISEMIIELRGEFSMYDYLGQEFRRIFTQHTMPLIIGYLGDDLDIRSLWRTIKSGRNRFRAGLAYLLSGQTELGKIIGAASEVAWAAILILDDIGDKTFIRRGGMSAWSQFGLLEASHAAMLGFVLARRILKRENVDQSLIEGLEESIEITLRAQIQHGNFNVHVSPETLLDNYSKKTKLGRWPVEASIALNDEIVPDAANKVVGFSELIVVVAQIKNDLDDVFFNTKEGVEVYEPPMKDLQNKMLNYPLALFFQAASEKERLYVMEHYWGHDLSRNPESTQNFVRMFSEHDIFKRCAAEINGRILFALGLVKDLKPIFYRELLESWVDGYRVS